MDTASRKPRLDEILIREGLVTEDQIKDALQRQREHGGRLGKHLLHHGYVDEAGLVKALAIQSGSEGVVLSNLDIPRVILKFIPPNVAASRNVLPFDYDPQDNTLKVACENPNDAGLANELNFIARGKKVKLYIASELSLEQAIASYYPRHKHASMSDASKPAKASSPSDTGGISTGPIPTADQIVEKAILLVTDDADTGALMKKLLETKGYVVAVIDSADDAIDLVGTQMFTAVFIQDTVPGDYLDVIDRVRKVSPRTRVRYYESAASLLVNDDTQSREDGLLTNALELFTSILSSKEKLDTNHSGTVGKIVDRLCRRIGLPDEERMSVVTAAYLHDLSLFYYGRSETSDYRETVQHSAKLLESLNCSPVVVGILRSMYKNLRDRYTKRLPMEALGGNIVTIVDLFSETFNTEQRMSLDRFDVLKGKINQAVGKLFLKEVAEAFIAMIQEQILQISTTDRHGQVMIFTEIPDLLESVEKRLHAEGFHTIVERSAETFVELYQRGEPDIMLLMLSGEPEQVLSFVNGLSGQGVDLGKVPTFLLVERSMTAQLSSLFSTGVEDVIALDASLDLLIVKLRRIREALQRRSSSNGQDDRNASGAIGRLADMNLIDLLQALGPSQRTVKITVTQMDSETLPLELYLKMGQIVHAKTGQLEGAEAVYEAVSWTEGAWTVEPIPAAQIPEANNELPNESILMEGCRRLDERNRDAGSSPAPAPTPDQDIGIQ